MPLAPIALFVYNRLEHTRQTIAALQKNDLAASSDLIIFSDAPKNELAGENVQAVREYLPQITGFKSVRIILREKNFGLAQSIITGVSEIVEQFGKVIVLEDDLITSPYFLKYLNEALGFYENNESVISIHAYVYPVKQSLPETFFLKGADCWGWATWKRGWRLFEPDGRKLLQAIKDRGLSRAFDLGGAYPYTQMLAGQICGLNNSWAVRWYASAFLNDRLTLYPGRSLVTNTGFDNSGTHTGSIQLFKGKLTETPIAVREIVVEENQAALKTIRLFFRQPRLYLFVSYLKIKNFIKLRISQK